MEARAGFISICLLALGALASCGYDPRAQESAIVREVEAAGSGNLDTSSPQGLGIWFGNHRQFANKISKECEPLLNKGDAHWAETAEGRVCAAVWANKVTDWKADARSW